MQDIAAYQSLNVVDEFTLEAQLKRVQRRVSQQDDREGPSWPILLRGVLTHIRSDNGSEFTAGRGRHWSAHLTVRPLLAEPGSPWENGYIESFNGKLR